MAPLTIAARGARPRRHVGPFSGPRGGLLRHSGPPMPPVFLAEHARALLVVHAVLGAAVVGALTHQAVFSWTTWRGSESGKKALRRIALVTPWVLVPQLALGLALYPAYKVGVRLAYLDQAA